MIRPWWIPEVPQSSDRSRCMARARGAVAAGGLEYALRHYRNYLRRCPTDVAVRRELREVQRALWAIRDRSDGLPPDQLRAASEDAVRRIELRPDPWQAIERLEDLLTLDPHLRSAHLWLARAAHTAEMREVALFGLRDALALDPLDVDALRVLGQLEAAQGRASNALAIFERVLSLRPGDPEARLLRELTLLGRPLPAPRWPEPRVLPLPAPPPWERQIVARQITLATAGGPPARPRAPAPRAVERRPRAAGEPASDSARMPIALLRPSRRDGQAQLLCSSSIPITISPARAGLAEPAPVPALPLQPARPLRAQPVAPAWPAALPQLARQPVGQAQPGWWERFQGPNPRAAWAGVGLYAGIALYYGLGGWLGLSQLF